MDSLLVKVIVQSLYTVLTLFGGGVHTSPTSHLGPRISHLESHTSHLESRTSHLESRTSHLKNTHHNTVVFILGNSCLFHYLLVEISTMLLRE